VDCKIHAYPNRHPQLAVVSATACHMAVLLPPPSTCHTNIPHPCKTPAKKPINPTPLPTPSASCLSQQAASARASRPRTHARQTPHGHSDVLQELEPDVPLPVDHTLVCSAGFPLATYGAPQPWPPAPAPSAGTRPHPRGRRAPAAGSGTCSLRVAAVEVGCGSWGWLWWWAWA
jgi:hypothetical protein